MQMEKGIEKIKIKDFFDSNGSQAKLQEFVITIDITSPH
jgi:hypothetical protein